MIGDRETAAGAAVILSLSRLTERQRYVFVSHALHDRPFIAIAAELGISRERVRQLYMKAQRKMASELEPWQAELAA